MNVLHILPEHIVTIKMNQRRQHVRRNTRKGNVPNWSETIWFFCFLLKLLSELCIIIANVVCLKHTRSFLFLPCTVHELRGSVRKGKRLFCVSEDRFVKTENHYDEFVCSVSSPWKLLMRLRCFRRRGGTDSVLLSGDFSSLENSRRIAQIFLLLFMLHP